MASLYQLPDELLLSVLFEQFPCREQQTRALATLLDVSNTNPTSATAYAPSQLTDTHRLL